MILTLNNSSKMPENFSRCVSPDHLQALLSRRLLEYEKLGFDKRQIDNITNNSVSLEEVLHDSSQL